MTKKGKVLWITGLPGTGKSTIAKELQKLWNCRVLEMDEIRKAITPSPKYTKEERELAYRSLAYMAFVISESGIDVIVDGTDNTGDGRKTARKLIENFAVVQLKASEENIRHWESQRKHIAKDLYKRADAGKIELPGVTAEYAYEEKPILTLETDKLSLKEVAKVIYEKFFKPNAKSDTKS